MTDLPGTVTAAFEERAAVEAQIFACRQRIAFLNGWIAANNDGNLDEPVPKSPPAPRRKR